MGYFFLHIKHPYQSIDRSSAANINEIRTEFIALDLEVRFDEKR